MIVAIGSIAATLSAQPAQRTKPDSYVAVRATITFSCKGSDVPVELIEAMVWGAWPHRHVGSL